MRHASLFSGIGGFDLAADWMGWDNALQCEYDEFCQTILKYYWPYATQLKDIKTTDFTPWAGSIDILTGGFPCQPFSSAGKRQGTEDDRHLWPEMLRAIQQVKPTFVLGENVSGILSWNGGLVFEKVCADLEAEGYEVQPLLLPASGVNAPHKRERTWFVAHTQQQGLEGQNRQELHATKEPAQPNRGNWQNFPTQSPLCGGNDGIPTGLDGITVPKWRKESIKAYGNAIVPQVAFQIFKAIQETMFYESTRP